MIIGLNDTQEALYLDFMKENNLSVHDRVLKQINYKDEIKKVVAAIEYKNKYLTADEYEKANILQGYNKAMEDIKAFKDYIFTENGKAQQQDELELKFKQDGTIEIKKYLSKSKIDGKLKEVSKIIDELERLSKTYNIIVLKPGAATLTRDIKSDDIIYESARK
jgi:hypothetical protein